MTRTKNLFIAILAINLISTVLYFSSRKESLETDHVYSLDNVYHALPVSEREVMMDPPYTDHLKCANATNSMVYIYGDKNSFELGDLIKVFITLKDGYKSTKTTGGDMVRVWMVDKANGANVAGYVIDHQNGSYTGILKACWVGSTNIIVSIAATRENIKFFYDTFQTYGSSRNISAIFHIPWRNQSIEALCSPEPMVFGYQKLCNLSNRNHGVSWYCGQPNLPGFECNYYTGAKSTQLHPLSVIDSYILQRGYLHPKIPHNISITIIPNRIKITLANADVPCNKVQPEMTWSHPQPSGYFYKQKWYPTYCKTDPNNTFKPHKCLSNRKMWLFGDSTAREWLYRMNTLFKIGKVSRRKTWHAPLQVSNQAWNFTLFWGPHELPFFSIDLSEEENHIPAHIYMKQIRNSSRDIIVFALYSHLTHYHPRIFQERLDHIYGGVVDLINRAPNVTIVFRGFHTYTDDENFARWHDDYFGLMFREITRKKFRPIRNRLIYLNHWDMTLGAENPQLHPTRFLDDIMITYLFTHICE